MPSNPAHVANALQEYNSAIFNVEQKLAQDRGLHMHELTNVYMEAVNADMPMSYLNMMENVIAQRSAFNDRKTTLDAMEWSTHDAKLKKALGSNQAVLSGGATAIQGHASSRAFEYAGARSNALLHNLYRKLAHDRSLHTQELENCYAESVKLAGGSATSRAFSEMVGNMVLDRRTYNARKTALDAAQWAQTDAAISAAGMGKLLSAGAHQKKH